MVHGSAWTPQHLPRSMIPESGSCRNLREYAGKSGISCRKTREITGSGSSIPAGNFRKIFRYLSGGFLQENPGITMEFTGKNPKIFRPQYCFHFPAISGAFLPCLFDLAYSNRLLFLYFFRIEQFFFGHKQLF